MRVEIGQVEAIFRYPVKSMGGERLDAANLGWHGLDGDRRLALRRMEDRGAFPWLSASKLPDLVLFTPLRREDGAGGHLPTHVRTPDGEEMDVFGADLAAEIGRRHGASVQMMQLKHGIFDEASISVIALDTATGKTRWKTSRRSTLRMGNRYAWISRGWRSRGRRSSRRGGSCSRAGCGRAIRRRRRGPDCAGCARARPNARRR